MAFTETWDEDAPDGAVITISQLDNFQRQTRVAVRERMEGDPSDDTTGVVETGTWSTGPILKAGAARFAYFEDADLNDQVLKDGRGGFTTDDGDGHPKVYALFEAGPAEIAYLNLDGARPLRGQLTVQRTVASTTALQRGISIALAQTEASYTVDDAIGLHIAAFSKGASVTITEQYGIKIDGMVAGATSYAIYTAAGLVRFGDEVRAETKLIVGEDGLADPATIEFKNQGGGQAIIQKNNDNGTILVAVANEFSVSTSGGEVCFRVTTGRSVVVGKSEPASDATDGFLYIPAVQGGPPTGVPTPIAGYAALVYDEDNEQIGIYDGGWKFAAVS